MSLLSPADVHAALADLPGWEFGDGVIVKQYEFDSFRAAIAFINRVAERADAADHHPELTNVYSKVRVALSTHSEGGVTSKDIALAREIEAVAAG